MADLRTAPGNDDVREQATQPVGETPTGPQIGTALLSGETFTDRPVVYTAVDGLALVEGDIVIGAVSDLDAAMAAARQTARAGLRGLHTGVTRLGRRHGGRRRPGQHRPDGGAPGDHRPARGDHPAPRGVSDLQTYSTHLMDNIGG
jgi:hypothetical protein